MNYYEEMLGKVKKGSQVFIAPGAYVIGNVVLEDKVSIWFNSVLRADFDSIKIGKGTNVQEGVLMHVDENAPIEVGENNIIGHGAILHGCKIGNHNLIGMRATVMNHAQIGNNCVIGAHALITENMKIPDNSLVLGMPGKIVKTLTLSVREIIALGAEEYIKEAAKYLK